MARHQTQRNDPHPQPQGATHLAGSLTHRTSLSPTTHRLCERRDRRGRLGTTAPGSAWWFASSCGGPKRMQLKQGGGVCASRRLPTRLLSGQTGEESSKLTSLITFFKS